MDKVYLKNGNSNPKNKHKYCKTHFMKKYGREPNILDTAHLGICKSCDEINKRCNND